MLCTWDPYKTDSDATGTRKEEVFKNELQRVHLRKKKVKKRKNCVSFTTNGENNFTEPSLISSYFLTCRIRFNFFISIWQLHQVNYLVAFSNCTPISAFILPAASHHLLHSIYNLLWPTDPFLISFVWYNWLIIFIN